VTKIENENSILANNGPIKSNPLVTFYSLPDIKNRMPLLWQRYCNLQRDSKGQQARSTISRKRIQNLEVISVATVTEKKYTFLNAK
jgi:hypothetical protein